MKRQGQALAEQGKLQQANALFEKLSRQHSNDADIWFMRGTICGSLGQMNECVSHLGTTLALQEDHPGALFNLGIAYLKLEQPRNAVECLLSLLRLEPQHRDAHLSLVQAYSDLSQPGDALHHLEELVQMYPNEVQYLFDSAQIRLHTGDPNTAIAELKRVLALKPSHREALKLMGDACKNIGDTLQAATHYNHALKLTTDDAQICREIGLAFKSMQMFDHAIHSLGKALKIDPGQKNIHYHLASLGVGAVPDKAPNDYVTKLFDYFSDDFEEKLLGQLEYKTPLALNTLLRKHLAGNHALDILDLGCGTGLCGPVLRDIASRLTGVDLSPRMLDKAREKAVYDELLVGDITQHLFPPDRVFELIIAADVFVYIGDLTSVFETSQRLLEPAGRFVFSTESAHDSTQDYVLQNTGRYQHSQGYLTALAGQFGFTIEEIIETEIRKNQGKAIIGNLALLTKK